LNKQPDEPKGDTSSENSKI